jgi:hypothetical protein
MPMRLIAGNFRIVKAQPDGDSIRFYPDDPSEWMRLGGVHQVRPNAKGGAQLRLDGIDALETHYGTTLGIEHQPLKFGQQGAARLLKWIGFSNVVRDANETVTSATPEQAPGYVLTRGADLYGRPVALVGRGDAPAASGSDVHVDIPMLRKTANYRLLDEGLVYPTYYKKLFPDLRNEMTRRVERARPTKGLWPDDKTEKGANIQGLQTLTDNVVLLPKLFRRLVDYLALSDGDPSLAGFPAYLAGRNDRIFILSTGHSTGFDFVVRVTGQRVRLTNPPEDLVFEER